MGMGHKKAGVVTEKALAWRAWRLFCVDIPAAGEGPKLMRVAGPSPKGSI